MEVRVKVEKNNREVQLLVEPLAGGWQVLLREGGKKGEVEFDSALWWSGVINWLEIKDRIKGYMEKVEIVYKYRMEIWELVEGKDGGIIVLPDPPEPEEEEGQEQED